MPYKVKGKCPIEDYLAALHINANESVRINKEELKEIILDVLNEHAKDFVWGVKGVHAVPNQFKLTTLKNEK